MWPVILSQRLLWQMVFPLRVLLKCWGHTNVQMTRHYARVLDRTVIREMSQVRMDFQLSL